jgi:hypothetical protein
VSDSGGEYAFHCLLDEFRDPFWRAMIDFRPRGSRGRIGRLGISLTENGGFMVIIETRSVGNYRIDQRIKCDISRYEKKKRL